MMSDSRKNSKASSGFRLGAVSLAFIIIVYQAALFARKTAELQIVANRDRPDTVFIYVNRAASGTVAETGHAESGSPDSVFRRSSSHSHQATMAYENSPRRRIETFRFNPNTVSVEDLQRLGLTQKQARSIETYRQKGGRFRRKEDFARSYAVPDSVFERLSDFIEIPKVDINKADSALFDTLPGIGGWFASKMVSYRGELGGYSYPEQLMDIYHFDREKYDALKDLIVCSPPQKPFRIWSLPLDSLRMHPYIRSYQTARSIVFYREHNPPDKLTPEGLEDAGIIDAETAARLGKCLLE